MALGTIDYTADNLLVAGEELVTDEALQLESGQSVVRGEVLKRGATGLVALTNIEYVQADATSVLHIETSASTVVAQGDLIFNISEAQMYQYVGAGATIDLTAAVFTNGGLYQKISKLDEPYTVALQTVDATAGALAISYMASGSVLGSQLTFAVGTISDFRDGFRKTNILVEE